MNRYSQPRRSRAYLSACNTSQIHPRNPWVVAFWSMISPGLGYFMQDRALKSLISIIWGIAINIKAHINLALLYSFTGDFELAKQTLDTRWLILYLAVYVFGIWDGYRGTVDINKQYRLADMEDAPLTPFVIATFDVNFLDKRTPWVAAAWSALMPGLGYLYVHKVIEGIFMIAWSILIFYYSHGLEAVHLTMTGHFLQAKAVLDMQWLLFLPATYTFVIYNCYVWAVETNKLFEKEQSKFLREHYQDPRFIMPIPSQR